MSLLNWIAGIFGANRQSDPSSPSSTLNPEPLLASIESILNPILRDLPMEHWKTLYRKREQLSFRDDYGDQSDDLWIKELSGYFSKNILPKIACVDLFVFKRYFEKTKGISYTTEAPERCAFFVTLGFVNFWLDHNQKNLSSRSEIESNSRPDNPYDYEQYCADILRKNGWDASVTKASGDQGGDIRAQKLGLVAIIQCKLYSKPVGNKAVQEVFAALKFYGADHGVVVTNHGFTKSAKILAKSNRVLLIHDSDLASLSPDDFKMI